MNKALRILNQHKGALVFLGLFVLVLGLDQTFGWSQTLAGEDGVKALHLLLEQNYWLAVAA